MSIFQWRIFGGRTLAYLLDSGEVRRLLDYGPGLGPQEALLVLPPAGGATAVMPDSPDEQGDGGLEWLIETPEGEARVLFVSDGPAESVRHMAFTTRDGQIVRVALKLLFRMNPQRPREIFDFLGDRQALSDADVDMVVGARAEASLSRELSGLAFETLRQQPQVQERLKQRLIEEVREFGAGLGLKVNGLGLAWGFDPGRVERMVAAAEKSTLEEAAFLAERNEALEELCLRRGIVSCEIAEAAPARQPVAPFEAEGEAGADLAFLQEEFLREPEPEPEPIRPKPAGRKLDPSAELGPEDALTKPLTNWHLYGKGTVAALLDEEAVPRIFRKDFALNDHEVGVVLSEGKVIDVITKGLERTGTALLWVRRLFCKGSDVKVLFFTTTTFTLKVDLEGFDAARDDVTGIATLGCRFASQNAEHVPDLLGRNGRLSLQDLEATLGEQISRAMESDLRLVVAGKDELKGLEPSLSYTIKRELARMGLEVFSIAYDWVADRDSYQRHKALFEARMEARMVDGARRSLEDLTYAIYLEQRRREDMKALVNLDPTDRGEVYRMLLRAAFSVAAFYRTAPTREEVETALAASRERIEELKLQAVKARAKAEETLRAGFIPPLFKGGERFAGEGEEGFLSSSSEGEYLGEGSDFDEQIDFFNRGRPALVKSAVSQPAPGPNPPPSGGYSRCPQCMSPMRSGDSSCSNCGKKL